MHIFGGFFCLARLLEAQQTVGHQTLFPISLSEGQACCRDVLPAQICHTCSQAGGLTVFALFSTWPRLALTRGYVCLPVVPQATLASGQGYCP
jgi:hypothetical protein